MKRLYIFLSLLAVLALVGCGGDHHQRVHHTKHGISPHAPGFATKPPPPGVLNRLTAPKATPTLEMFDSIEYNVPGYAQAVAGYAGGSWPTWYHFTQLFPNLNRQGRVVSIAINSSERAQCLDVEPGDASPSEAVPWVRQEIASGISRPCVYAAISDMFNAVLPRLSNAGLYYRTRHWCAWLRSPRRPGLVGGCDAVQWTFTALGRNLDESTVALSFFGAVPPPPKPKPDKYAVLPAGYVHTLGGKLSERASVKAYDARGCAKRSHRDAACNHYKRELVALEYHLRNVIHHSKGGAKIRHRALRLQIMQRRSR